MRRLLNLLLLATGMFCLGAAYAEAPLKVVVCAGQSNMLGKRSTVTELPEALQGTQQNQLINLSQTGGNSCRANLMGNIRRKVSVRSLLPPRIKCRAE